MAIMALTYDSFAVTIETTTNLNVYYPEYTKIDLVCGKMPKATQKDVEFCCEAAFTGESSHGQSPCTLLSEIPTINSGCRPYKSELWRNQKMSSDSRPVIYFESILRFFEKYLEILKSCAIFVLKNNKDSVSLA